MKLNKKRITILVSLMCLLVLLVFTLCSFDLPDYPSTYSELLVTSGISSQDLSNILGIFRFQDLTGQFNSLIPLCIFINAQNKVVSLFAVPSSSLTITSSYYENTWYYSFKNNTNTNLTFVLIGLSDQGFCVYNTSYTGEYRVLRSQALYYRPSYDADLTLNSYFTPNSSVTNQDILSVFNYWNGYVSRLSGSGSGASPEELESAYDNGYESGFGSGFDDGYFEGLESGLVWGEELGYQEGYTEGYEEGIGTGYMHGYQAGEADGYFTGYDDGYQDGYDTGYSDGLEDAPSETVTIVIYEEPVEIDVPGIIGSISSIPDSILSGSFDFEFAGINIYGLLKLLIIVFIISAVIFFIIKRSA